MSHPILKLSWLWLLLAFTQFGCSDLIDKPQSKADATEASVESVLASGRLFSVALEWNTPLVAEDYLDATLRFTEPNGAPAEEISAVEFIPEMPSMGHGTVMDEQTVTATGVGVFHIAKIYLIMGGEWVITVKAKINGKADTALITVQVP